MFLKRLHIVNYRNVVQADLGFAPKINAFIGQNGMGKTNILDAVYYLSFCNGAVCRTDNFNLHHDADFFMIQGTYEVEEGADMTVSCSLKRGQRKHVKCDGKDYKRF